MPRETATTLSKWWICSSCNHWNHPRAGLESGKCEQCGKKQDTEDAPYDPAQLKQ